MGFFFHQLSVEYNLILDLAIRNGNFFKLHGKSNNEKEIFLVLYLAQDSSDSQMGGACLVPGGLGMVLFFRTAWACCQASRSGACSWGPRGIPRIYGLAGLIGRNPQRKLLCASAISGKRLQLELLFFHFPKGEKSLRNPRSWDGSEVENRAQMKGRNP